MSVWVFVGNGLEVCAVPRVAWCVSVDVLSLLRASAVFHFCIRFCGVLSVGVGLDRLVSRLSVWAWTAWCLASFIVLSFMLPACLVL